MHVNTMTGIESRTLRHAWAGVVLLYCVLFVVLLRACRPSLLPLWTIALAWVPFLSAMGLLWHSLRLVQPSDGLDSSRISVTDHPTASKDFLLQEHKVLADEIAAQLGEMWGFEKFALGAAAAIAAWLP